MSVEHMETAGPAAFAEKGAHLLAEHIRQAVAERGTCTIGLCGGTTPGPVYTHLSAAEGIDWKHVFVFLLDERMVPAEDENSNHRLVWQTLCAPAHIPESNMLFPKTTLDHKECAAEYAQRLEDHLVTHALDIATVGMGPDGHITSLFPPLPKEASGPATVIPAFVPDENGRPRFVVRERISVTIPLLQKSLWTLFLLGEKKRAVWNEMMGDAEGFQRWPAKALLDGNVTVLL